MTIPRPLRLLALGAVAATTLAPYAADSGTCANAAAGDLLAASYFDSQLNSPKGEDTDFFIKAGGVPNIMVLLDTTGSMNRLPPDGPNNFGAALPPGYYIGSSKTNSTTQTNAFDANNAAAVPGYPTCKALAADTCTSNAECCSNSCVGTPRRCVAASPRWTSPATNNRIVGCGIDPVSAGSAAFTGSAMYQELESRRFYPPCGQAVDPALVGAPYSGAADYGATMTVCPYFTPSNSQATGAPGFDPDYYNPTDPTATTSGTKRFFFGRTLIFHDNPDMNAGWARSTTLAFGHNFGDGFYYDGLSPHLDKATGTKSTIASYCSQQGAAAPRMQGTLSHSAICNTCLSTKGWYYDGVIYQAGENTAPTPSVWYTGNYLNHFPPKFLIARKVMKDIIAVQSRVRMALATFANSGATFIQPFNPSCGMPDSSNFDSNRASYVSGVDGIDFSGGTPMAVSLFDAGRYYHSPDLPWFGASWEKTGAYESAANANQYAICYACQTSNIILLTDGQPTSGDGSSLPSVNGLTAADLISNKKAGDASTGICKIPKAVCPECAAFLKGTTPTCAVTVAEPEAFKDSLAKVAFYLHNMDLRKDTEATLDCKFNSGKQTLDTYTIGFATKSIPGVNTILGNAAKAGGGIFIPAENTTSLKEGFNAIIEEINGRSTSFSIATVSTLQTTEGSTVIIPRFQPAKTAHWEGHLSRYEMYSEFVEGCTPGGDDDYDCDGVCDGIFLQDRDGDFISEDVNGGFVKNDPPGKPTCAQVPKCGTDCAVPGSAPAKPLWDGFSAWGNNTLATKQEWKARTVWTAVDIDHDGDIDAADAAVGGMIQLSTTNGSATEILPYLALGGGSICNSISGRFAGAGDLASATLVSGDQVECAKSIIRYILGADLFNERGVTTGYPPPTQDDAADRPSILGDIFHSSPVVVEPPRPINDTPCKLGLVKQCLVALWDTDTTGADVGYVAYHAAYEHRRKVVLVGANDGMLHAFNGGQFVATADGGDFQSGREEAEAKYATDGTWYPAIELWAFIPPDLLSKLPLYFGSEHQLYVDGTAMVRDVWVDGSKNDALEAGSLDDVKEGGEYHTVAVVGERRGGTRYFALDVTDAYSEGSKPGFRWIYPQPNASENLTFAETYNDFLPQHPPIGPVRIAADGSPGNGTNADTNKYTFDGSDTPYHERWVTFLNGGYDPQYVRGRGVHAVDVWTGAELFDFSYPDAAHPAAAGDPRYNLRFPIPAPVAMIRWGRSEMAKDYYEPPENYFDTATFGDTGGQLWTLRFHVPGKLGADGRVTNWFGARSFQMGGRSDCKLCGGQPFFYMTANGATPGVRLPRTYLGTGDRYNLMDKYGGTCSPTNLHACIFRGCTVTVTAASNLLSAPGGYAQRGMSEVACNAIANTEFDGPATGCTADGKAKVAITACPSPEPNNAPTGTTKEVSVACTELADGYSCSRALNVPGTPLALSNTANAVTLGNWFFSLRIFREGGATDPNSRPVFTTLDEAKVHDAHRLFVTQNNGTRTASAGLTLIDGNSSTPSTAAEDSDGWAMYYNHGPAVTIAGVTVAVDWRDERTSSGTLLSDVLSWNTVQPTLDSGASTGSCRVSRCTQEGRRVAWLYGAEPVGGGLLKRLVNESGQTVRATGSFRLVPAQALQNTYYVNKKGEVKTKATGVSDAGAGGLEGGETLDPVSETGMLLIDKELYMCRYADTPICR